MTNDNGILTLGRAGCQPVAFGSLAECMLWAQISMEVENPFAAGCRELQASSLRSPE
jgi:hypothetical protein